MDFKQEALKEAQKSRCKKRKVGAIIVNAAGKILGRGYNYNPEELNEGCCEDSNGNTFSYVIHAEVATIEYASKANNSMVKSTMYVTHQPCDNCSKAIKEAGIKEVIVIDNFMKFDSGKLRYSLIPPLMTKALASVLTYGAKKYKPNNWQNVDDTNRYWDALYRHLEARRSGEMLDPESKLPHLWHAITNVGFLLFLDNKTKPNPVQNDLSDD